MQCSTSQQRRPPMGNRQAWLIISLLLGIFSAHADGFSTIPGAYLSRQSTLKPGSNHIATNTRCWGFTRKSSTENGTKKKNKWEKPIKLKKLTPSNDLMTNHKHRLETAGKEGTLRYVDPTLVFIGNLNFTATEEQLRNLLTPLVPSPWDVSKVRIVRDWKTGDSKGYAFVRFTEPVFATLCLQEINGKEFLGRNLKVTPAQSKSESPLRKQQREEKQRLKELRRAQNPPPPPPPPKPENPEFLAYLDPDLVGDMDAIIDAGLMVDAGGDDDDDDYDGDEVPGSPPPKGFG